MDPWDAMCRLMVADRLRTGFAVPIPASDADWKARSEVWRDSRAVVGGSDAGAHLDTMCGAVYSTSLLGDGVRKRQLLSVEEAVRLLTDVPARLYGLIDRGRVAEGWWADLVVFDPERIGPGPLRTRDDLPGGASRLFADATGVEHVLVNGTEVVTADRLTGAVPGRVLRSGTDTRTAVLS
jgi:N-acyl-D-aspartate/D-glutamate deacylase